MRKFALYFTSVILGYFIIRDMAISVDNFNNFSTEPNYSYILLGITELVKSVILSLFLVTLWLAAIAMCLGGIHEAKGDLLGQSSNGTEA